MHFCPGGGSTDAGSLIIGVYGLVVLGSILLPAVPGWSSWRSAAGCAAFAKDCPCWPPWRTWASLSFFSARMKHSPCPGRALSASSSSSAFITSAGFILLAMAGFGFLVTLYLHRLHVPTPARRPVLRLPALVPRARQRRRTRRQPRPAAFLLGRAPADIIRHGRHR